MIKYITNKIIIKVHLNFKILLININLDIYFCVSFVINFHVLKKVIVLFCVSISIKSCIFLNVNLIVIVYIIDMLIYHTDMLSYYPLLK